MKGSIACRHQSVSCIDGENACTNCGVVFGAEYVNENIYRNANAQPNLFVSRSLGTRNDVPSMAGMEGVKRYFRGGMSDERTLSCFSNVCEKLRLPQHIHVDAHNRFERICKQVVQKTAGHACVAIFRTCRSHGIPIPESDIIGAVRVSFGRKKMVSMTKPVYQHMHVDKEEGGDKGERYYFYLILHRRHKDGSMPEREYHVRLSMAWFLFCNAFRHGTISSRARRSIDHAFAMTVPLNGGSLVAD